MMLMFVILALVFLTLWWVARATSGPAPQPATNADLTTAYVPLTAASLPDALMQAATDQGRKIALMITKTDPMKWEIESDHCHYRGSPALSFTYPLGQHHQGVGFGYSSYHPSRRYPNGLFMGGEDRDMREPILKGADDENLIMAAVQDVCKRRTAIKQQQAELARQKAERERVAKLDQFMAGVDRYQ